MASDQIILTFLRLKLSDMTCGHFYLTFKPQITNKCKSSAHFSHKCKQIY